MGKLVEYWDELKKYSNDMIVVVFISDIVALALVILNELLKTA